MKIFHLIPQLSGGGAERQLSYLSTSLAKKGNEVHIAFLNEGNQKPELPGVILHQIKSKSNYDPYILLQLMQIFLKVKPDIIHTWIYQMDILGSILAHLFNIPMVLREPTSKNFYVNNWRDNLRLKVGKRANAIVSNSEGGDNYWKDFIPKNKRYIIRNGLPVDFFDEIKPNISLKKEDVPKLVYIGRLVKNKNLVALIQAVALVRKKTPVQLILCGEGVEREELVELVKRLNMQDDIIFTGFLSGNEVISFVKSAKIFISLSNYEGCPNTVIEAMACGTPIIVSDIEAHREILNEQSAFFVDRQNINEIANKILFLLFNYNEAIDRANVAKEKTKDWNIENMTKSYETVYNTIKKK